MKDNEFQRNKIAIFSAKIEELEQHVGILSNAAHYQEPEDQGEWSENNENHVDTEEND